MTMFTGMEKELKECIWLNRGVAPDLVAKLEYEKVCFACCYTDICYILTK
jgi:hypothetical protein